MVWWIVLGVAVLVVVYLLASVKVVSEYERGVVFLFGRIRTVREPGLRFVPAVAERMERVSLQITTIDIPARELITSDSVTVQVNAVAWYRFGPAPLSDAGATVLAGHVDTRREGAGPLAGLVELEVGDRVLVGARGGTVVYAVTSVTRIRKAVLDLPTLFSRVGRPRLHLITCGGDFDRTKRHYEQNVLVLAFMAP
jgi:sortase (surface protein transpeptidase)